MSFNLKDHLVFRLVTILQMPMKNFFSEHSTLLQIIKIESEMRCPKDLRECFFHIVS